MSGTSETRMAYVGYCPTCDGLCAAHVITDVPVATLQEFVADLVSERLRIATVPSATVREATWCACPPRP